jgi:hypothetical protein
MNVTRTAFTRKWDGIVDYVMMPPMREFSTPNHKQVEVLAAEEPGGNRTFWYEITESKRAMCYNSENDKITKTMILYPYTASIHEKTSEPSIKYNWAAFFDRVGKDHYHKHGEWARYLMVNHGTAYLAGIPPTSVDVDEDGVTLKYWGAFAYRYIGPEIIFADTFKDAQAADFYRDTVTDKASGEEVDSVQKDSDVTAATTASPAQAAADVMAEASA